jgi:hypothetical protein
MPYVEHERYTTPSDTNKIWRYIDFTQFVYMLEYKALFFPSIAILRGQDPYEGSFYNFIHPKLRPIFQRDSNAENIVNAQNIVKTFDSELCSQSYVNCWHINNGESAALWKLYPKSNEGIAIVSTVARFKKAITNTQEKVYLLKIVYGDKKKLSTPVHKSGRSMYIIDLIIYKRACFRHENEIRAFVYHKDLSSSSITNNDGLLVDKVDLNKLVQKIIVGPESPSWLCDLVKKVCQTYGYDFKVTRSDLFKAPL